MKTTGITLLLVGAVLLALPLVGAEETGQTTFSLTAKNPEFYWTDASGGHNPTLVVPAGETITVTFANSDQDGFHAFKVGDVTSDNIETAGQSQTVTFTAPQSGSVDYVCPYHVATMTGTVRVAGSVVEEKAESPGVALVGALVALAGAALVLRRK